MENKKQTHTILSYFNYITGLKFSTEENESISEVIFHCQKSGKLLVDTEEKTSWYFVLTTHKTKNCMRMVFVLPDSENEKVVKIIKDAEKQLVFIDHIKIDKIQNKVYMDMIKYIN